MMQDIVDIRQRGGGKGKTKIVYPAASCDVESFIVRFYQQFRFNGTGSCMDVFRVLQQRKVAEIDDPFCEGIQHRGVRF